MEFKSKIFVTFANKYAMDNGTKGMTVNYFMLNENDLLNMDTDNSKSQGEQSAKANALSYDDQSKFIAVPGFYEGKFVMSTGSDRKPTLKLVDVEFICQGNLFPIDGKGEPVKSIDLLKLNEKQEKGAK